MSISFMYDFIYSIKLTEHININTRKFITSDLRFSQLWLNGTIFLGVTLCSPVEVYIRGSHSGDYEECSPAEFAIWGTQRGVYEEYCPLGCDAT
jgi:hypothetical protein